MASRLAILITAGVIGMYVHGCRHAPVQHEVKPQLVTEVVALSLNAAEPKPRQLVMTAEGIVPSPGWTDPVLVPVTYVHAPPDGIYDFDFVALPPSDRAGQQPTRVIAKRTLSLMPAGVKGVRIRARTNDKVEMFRVAASNCIEFVEQSRSNRRGREFMRHGSPERWHSRGAHFTATRANVVIEGDSTRTSQTRQGWTPQGEVINLALVRQDAGTCLVTGVYEGAVPIPNTCE